MVVGVVLRAADTFSIIHTAALSEGIPHLHKTLGRAEQTSVLTNCRINGIAQ